ncbi:phage minor head protein [Nocardia wallacei]|uniref:phage minor head protein n=1 Tax=Nocardia wallacei TaxID=480035 RepID=UPI002458CBFD|nr:phage minor head protein [Nocardia wallacei]
MRQEQRAALVEVLALEREIEDLAADALTAWLHIASAAALPALTAAAIPPDPDAITHTTAAWERELDRGFLPRFAAIVDRLLGPDRDRLEEWRSRTLASVRERLLSIPARAAKKVQAAIRDAAGQAVEAVRELAARALSPARWRGDAAEIGRTNGAAIYNATKLARAALEERDTGVALDKVWLSLHDGRTRHTHQLADRQRVALAANFVVGGAALRFPGDPYGPPGEVINCRCVIAIVESALENRAPARVASAADTGGTMAAKAFEALLIPTGVVGRSGYSMLAAGAELVDTVLPLPLKWQRADVPAHDGSVTVGAIEKLEMRDGGVWGIGTMLDNAETAEVEQQIEAGVTQPSAELVVRAETMTDASGTPITMETAEQLYMDGAQIVMRWDAVEIVGASLVSVPEFRDTSIALRDAEPGTVPPKLSVVAAVANARIVEPHRYPHEFFTDPELAEPIPIQVNSQGRVIGYLALWESKHRAYPDMPVTPYRTHNGYADFHQTTAHLDNGTTMAVGRLTVGGGHGIPGKGVQAALAHHDDVSTCWSYVVAGENDLGIWVSGAIHFAADEQMVKLALGTPHSGHWERTAGGWPELIIAHAVNDPGFANYYQRAADRDGDLGMVACFAPAPVQPVANSALLDAVAERAVLAFVEHQAGQERTAEVHSLVQAAGGRRKRILADAIRANHAARAGAR